ncbi:uncharacterized protein LOC123309558 isoform X2 [Coccinella septempunctata]|uniref:uncharacterized protein LOC123309558 isoform X2 n=1 Tax=Coccinella septempunctata TaxID=41139 RepID=UPI001D0824B7|nr:uncharacterized protein LOC123309558 isoform X2 [Coccinella septempunctata]
MHQQTRGWILFSLLVSSSIVSTLSYPNIIPTHEMQSGFLPSNLPSDMPQLPSQRQDRKFAEKPNAIKKVALDDLSNDLETNQISDGNGEGFSWSNLLSMLMQMIFNPGTATGPNKSDSLDDNSVAPSPWANLLAAGLKILTAILGGGASSEGIDKVDNGGSPMQGILAGVLTAVMGGRDPQQVNALAKQAGEFVNILVNLLNALKTSFSHRSIMARNIGRRDSMSEAAVAGITMMKGYVKSVNALSVPCQQKTICEANRECAMDIGQSSLFCHLGNYAASYMIDRTSSTGFSVLYEAGRRGRAGDNCHQTYQECRQA